MQWIAVSNPPCSDHEPDDFDGIELSLSFVALLRTDDQTDAVVVDHIHHYPACWVAMWSEYGDWSRKRLTRITWQGVDVM
jgi:hypothetical protein